MTRLLALLLALVTVAGVRAQDATGAPASASASAPTTTTTTTASAGATLPNTWCPVMTWQQASPEFKITFDGQDLFFCCEDCVKEFGLNPRGYLENLPQFEGADLDRTAAQIREQVVGASETSARPWYLYAAAALILVLIVRVLRRPRGPARIGQAPAGVSSELLKLVVVILLGLLIALSVALYQARSELYDLKLIDMLHHATFKDFGDPPRPLHPPVPARLKGTYWRGNDERNPKLYNGGHYLTTQFHTSIRTDEGEDLAHGSEAGGRKLWVRLEVERAPNTAPFFYSDEIMDSIVISRESGNFVGSPRHPIPDPVKLKTLEKMQRWEARYPIGAVPPKGPWRTRGVVYVYQLVTVPETGEVLGARYHYGLEYEVSTLDGVVQPESDLWMGFFYRTRKSGVNKVPPREWFSHEPIPAIPDGAAVTDPTLLGTGDYDGVPEG